ncbi:MAG: hypothetical protein AAFW64_11075 [Pseudomonadota bacterium]
MIALQSLPPLTRGFIAALVYAAVVMFAGWNNPDDQLSDLWVRTVFAFAAGLVFQPGVDGAALMRGLYPSSTRHRWMYGYILGAGWAIIMMLAFWPNREEFAPFLFVWCAAGGILGAIMALGKPPKPTGVIAIAEHYATETAQFERSSVFATLYLLWPVLTWAFIFIVVEAYGGLREDPKYIWFLMIFFVGINHAFAPREEGWSIGVKPMNLGFLLMIWMLFVG